MLSHELSTNIDAGVSLTGPKIGQSIFTILSSEFSFARRLWPLRKVRALYGRSTPETYPDVQKAVLCGSRATGNYNPGSDIDLTLVGGALILYQLNAVAMQLDDLLLPCELGLSICHQIDKPDLLEHIERVGVIFYTR
ncbi:MAG: hypothetical protein DRR04_00130 [Gammaproteobacteria bacterium]|nr:MAG: hypothetical protein DRQ97_00555 [Gammaproteobacteria bacterium]RLA62413.1 MAG: hypothetical protein DRR04_00130 [Gammaproteobacteria bacterium]